VVASDSKQSVPKSDMQKLSIMLSNVSGWLQAAQLSLSEQ